MTKSWDKKVVLFKDEVTEGVDSAPVVATNGFRVRNYQPTFMDADGKVRALEKAYLGADPVTMSAFKRGASFEIEMAGGGAPVGTVPQWMKFARYCGFAAPVIVATTSATQDPSSTVVSGTHWAYLDNLLMKATGGRGSMGYTIEDDEIPIFNCSYLGIPPTVLAEEATPGAVVLAGVTDPVISSTENTEFLLGGFEVPLRRMTMNANADLQYRSLIGPPDKIMYRNRNWNGQIVIELPDLATKNYFTQIRPGTTMASSLAQGNIAGNIVTITHPALQITGNVELSEEQGCVMATMPVTALPVVGNDEVKFVAT